MRLRFASSRFAALVAPLALAVAGEALAQTSDPLVTDRPDFTESAVTVQPGRVQIEAGYTFSRQGDVKGHGIGELLFRIGAFKWAEVRIAVNSYSFENTPEGTERGVNDAFLGAKLKLVDNAPEVSRWRPGVALLVGTTLPTGSNIFGADDAQPEAKLALSWELTPQLSVGSNLNVALISTGEEQFGQFSGSLALGVGITERLASYVEFFGFRHDNPEGPDLNFLNGGFTLLASDDVQFDIRGGIGFNDIDPDYFAGLGLSWRF